jgi:hypothetical protein
MYIQIALGFLEGVKPGNFFTKWGNEDEKMFNRVISVKKILN